MNRELVVYLRLQVAIAASFNFFKSVFPARVGAFATCAVLYASMCGAG